MKCKAPVQTNGGLTYLDLRLRFLRRRTFCTAARDPAPATAAATYTPIKPR